MKSNTKITPPNFDELRSQIKTTQAILDRIKRDREAAQSTIEYFKTAKFHSYPTLKTFGTLGIADPCHIMPNKQWHEFLEAYWDSLKGGCVGNQDISVFIFQGIPWRVTHTGSDGLHRGVMVNSGCLAEFPWGAAKKKFKFRLIPISKSCKYC